MFRSLAKYLFAPAEEQVPNKEIPDDNLENDWVLVGQSSSEDLVEEIGPTVELQQETPIVEKFEKVDMAKSEFVHLPAEEEDQNFELINSTHMPIGQSIVSVGEPAVSDFYQRPAAQKPPTKPANRKPRARKFAAQKSSQQKQSATSKAPPKSPEHKKPVATAAPLQPTSNPLVAPRPVAATNPVLSMSIALFDAPPSQKCGLSDKQLMRANRGACISRRAARRADKQIYRIHSRANNDRKSQRAF